jgi:phage replication initiation protein
MTGLPELLRNVLAQRAAAFAGACSRSGGQRSELSPPALTGGESTLRAKVDWFTATWLPESQDEHIGAAVHDWFTDALGGVMGESVAGMFGYDHGVRYYIPMGGSAVSVGSCYWGGAHHGGRARVELSGTGCSRVLSWLDFQNHIANFAELKLTRIDLAVDLLDGEFNVEDCANWYQAGEFIVGGRPPRHSLIGDWLNPVHGRTFEVGRRENGKMLRCYEKGRQLGDPSSQWTRFEVEIRNNDRDIPLDILTDSDKYFTGAYSCLERILDAAAERIKTHQKEGEISLENLTEYARTSYGQLVHVLRGVLDSGQVIEALSRPGIPKRLERASLGGFLNGSPPDLLM